MRATGRTAQACFATAPKPPLKLQRIEAESGRTEAKHRRRGITLKDCGEAEICETGAKIENLRECMPGLIALYPEREALLQGFETLARLILGAIGDAERRQAWWAIHFILIDFGYVPEWRADDAQTSASF